MVNSLIFYPFLTFIIITTTKKNFKTVWFKTVNKLKN